MGFLSSHGEPFTEEELRESDSHVTFVELASVSLTGSLNTGCFSAVSASLWCGSMTKNGRN